MTGGGFPGQKTLSHPPKALNRHLKLHSAVQSKCQGVGDGKQFWKHADRIEKAGCDFSCLDVPTSSADKAVMNSKVD